MEAWASEGGCHAAVYMKTKSGERYRKLVEYGDRCAILSTKQRVFAVQWRVKGPRNDADEMALAVQRVLASAQEGHEWPAEMPDSARRQVIPGDGNCLYWALSAVDGKGGRAAADKLLRALTDADLAQPPESEGARQVMRDAGVRTWGQYLDKMRTEEIWGGACEVGRWAHQRECKEALYRELGPKGVYRKMAEVGEGGRAAAALLWSRRGGVHYELLWPPEEEEEEEIGEGDEREKTDVEEVAMEIELVTGGEIAEHQGTRGRPGGQDNERVWQDQQQVQIQREGAGWRYQGQECPVRERREVGEGSTRDGRQGVGWEGVLGVRLQRMEYEEVPEGTGRGEWNMRQEGRVDLWVTEGGGAVLQLQHREDLGAAWGAERAAQLHSERALWMELV